MEGLRVKGSGVENSIVLHQGLLTMEAPSSPSYKSTRESLGSSFFG